MKKMLHQKLHLLLTIVMIFTLTIAPVQPTLAEAQVYVTPTGSCYHTYKCGRGNYYLVTLSTAKARGLRPCKKCYTGPAVGSDDSSKKDSSSTKKDTPSVAKLKLSTTSLVLLKDQSKTLTAKSATGTVSWSSSDKSVAIVSNGKITAKSKGTATITAKTQNQTATCKVKVEEAYLSKDTLSLTINSDEKQLKIKGCSHDVSWSVGNEAIATIDSYGYIEPLSTGKTTVTAKVHGQKFKCAVTVTGIKLKKLSFDRDITLYGTDDDCYVFLEADDSEIFDYEEPHVSCSDTSVVKISDIYENCIELISLAPGTATITATIGGKTAKCKVTVEPNTSYDLDE